MKLLIDRPWSATLDITEGKGAGREVIAQLGWGEDNDPRPAYVVPIVKRGDIDHMIDQIDGPFATIEEANSVALAAAMSWYERGNS